MISGSAFPDCGVRRFVKFGWVVIWKGNPAGASDPNLPGKNQKRQFPVQAEEWDAAVRNPKLMFFPARRLLIRQIPQIRAQQLWTEKRT